MARILLVVPRMNIGGAETYVYTIAKELYARGHTVFLASGGGKFANELARLGIKTFFVPLRFSKRLAVFLLKRIIRKFNIDLVHANSGDAGVRAAFLKRSIDIPVVYTAHGIFGDIDREYIINEVDKIICVSEFVRQRAITQKFDEDKLVTSYCGVDTDRFKPDASVRTALRNKYGVTGDTLVLITVSRIKNLSHKGHQALMDMFVQYAQNNDWKLFVLGKGNAFLKLKYKVKEYKLQDKIVLLGHHTDVEKYINMADIYVSPTVFETFGLAIAEGMATGKPAIAYRVGGTPEVIKDDYSGYLVEFNDIKDMYEKILLLDKNRDKLDLMSQNARQWVSDNFSNSKMVDEIEAIYKEVLSK